VKPLQTKSPCLTGSTAEWRTVRGRLQIIIDAHTLGEAATARIARQTEQRIGS
jgi:hypothetical protein